MKSSIKEFTQINKNTTSYFMNGIKAMAQKRVEQDADLVLKNIKCKKLGPPHDELLLTTDRRFNYYKAIEDRISCKDGLFSRKYYEETASVGYCQILVPKHLRHLVSEKLRSLQAKLGKHPGITKTKFLYREK